MPTNIPLVGVSLFGPPQKKGGRAPISRCPFDVPVNQPHNNGYENTEVGCWLRGEGFQASKSSDQQAAQSPVGSVRLKLIGGLTGGGVSYPLPSWWFGTLWFG